MLSAVRCGTGVNTHRKSRLQFSRVRAIFSLCLEQIIVQIGEASSATDRGEPPSIGWTLGPLKGSIFILITVQPLDQFLGLLVEKHIHDHPIDNDRLTGDCIDDCPVVV